ncbi:hypothetical protein PC9H_004072 [Pleurotus ostreatus]|uniref:Uncharacterized protein n=1 Tax=Pleurotus ostreatus TaxID=5322 RepID=A0A8H7A6Z6_PLEOS|nr:uncharacterized protein PC9H_004072 [Pleurotus ostreatus]KAF7437235.1 hypothetical protein PC9H_004072 [Pleurotus ostreatus]
MFNEYQHQDFDVVSTVDKFGGVEELAPKDNNLTQTRFFRKSLSPGDEEEFSKLMEFQEFIMKDGCHGTIHPMYEHDGLKWVLMSVPSENFEASGLSGLF